MVLDATKDDSQKQRLERELETVGIRLNEEPPNLRITKTAGGGVKINRTMALTYLDDRVIENILREYKIFNADVVVREDVTADQFIDVLEGNRKYVRCVYTYNKIDMLSMAQLDEYARKSHACVVS